MTTRYGIHPERPLDSSLSHIARDAVFARTRNAFLIGTHNIAQRTMESKYVPLAGRAAAATVAPRYILGARLTCTVPPGTKRISATAMVSMSAQEGVSYHARLITSLGSSPTARSVPVEWAISDANARARLKVQRGHGITAGMFITSTTGLSPALAGRIAEVDDELIYVHVPLASTNYGGPGVANIIGTAGMSTQSAEPSSTLEGPRQSAMQWTPGGILPVPIEIDADLTTVPTVPTQVPVALALAFWMDDARDPRFALPVPHSCTYVAVYAHVDPQLVGADVPMQLSAGRAVTTTPMVALRDSVLRAVELPVTHCNLNFGIGSSLGGYPEVTGDATVDTSAPFMRSGDATNGQGEREIWRGPIHIPHPQSVTLRWQGSVLTGAPTYRLRLRRVSDDAIMLETSDISGNWITSTISRSTIQPGGVGRLPTTQTVYRVTLEVVVGTGTVISRWLSIVSDDEGYSTGV